MRIRESFVLDIAHVLESPQRPNAHNARQGGSEPRRARFDEVDESRKHSGQLRRVLLGVAEDERVVGDERVLLRVSDTDREAVLDEGRSNCTQSSARYRIGR